MEESKSKLINIYGHMKRDTSKTSSMEGVCGLNTFQSKNQDPYFFHFNPAVLSGPKKNMNSFIRIDIFG